jgi:F5/8 type C domain/PEP-CTERM motif
MKMYSLLICVATSALSSSAMAGTNILPGSGDTVTGSSIHAGFDATIAAGNLINGTTNQTAGDGDTRWVFADGSSADQTLTVDLGSLFSVDSADFSYNGVDRFPLSFEVLTSTDGVTFNVVAGPSPVTDFGTDVTITSESSFAPTSAKYVEFNFGQFSGIDPGNGGTGGGPDQGAGIYQLSVGVVPEPSTWAMMGIGFAALAFAGYRTSRKAVSMAA